MENIIFVIALKGVMKKWLQLVVVMVMVLGIRASVLAMPPYQYIITDLGEGIAQDINNNSQVVGSSPSQVSFYWDIIRGRENIDLGGHGGFLSVNDVGEVVQLNSSHPPKGRIWDSISGEIKEIPIFPNAINNSGYVTGWSCCSGDGGDLAVVWDDINGIQVFAGGINGNGLDVNDDGRVVGRIATDGQFNGFIWDNSNGLQNIPTLGGNNAESHAINNLGQVVGTSRYSLTSIESHAFLWDEISGIQDLGTLGYRLVGSDDSQAFDVNINGEVVGRSNSPSSTDNTTGWNGWVASIWDETHGMRDLNLLIPSDTGWILGTAFSINDHGQIVGYGGFNGEEHAFLLTPVPPSIYLWLEAESAETITNPMKIANDGTASGGQYIWVPNGQGHNFDGTGGYAEYTINVTVEGEYILWGRVIAPTSSDDSFFVKVGGSAYKAWSVAKGSNWQWDEVNSKGEGPAPVKYYLTAGEHTIKIGQREDGTKLDKLLLTNDMNYVPTGTGGGFTDVDGDGFAAEIDDCDDTNPAINPGATEVCDGVDNNCDGQTDENLLTTPYYQDFDGDTYGDPSVTQDACTQPAGFVMDNTDCDDTNPDINPGVTEICDGVDNNCNGQTDEGLLTTYYEDSDSDTYGNPLVSQDACSQPAGYVLDNTDCDDTDPNEYPGQIWYQDSDGDTYGNIVVSQVSCTRPAGYVKDNTDCDDTDAAVNLGAAETYDGVDNNCDGQVDEGLAATPYFWLEAETAENITNPMQVANDGAASGEQYIWVPNGQGHNFDGTGGYAEYPVNITEEGEYILWGRVIAPTSSDDSFFVKVGDSAYKPWSVTNGSSWQWDKVNIKGGADPVKYYLTTGIHTIRIGQREDGTKLDRLLLTNDMSYVPTGTGGNSPPSAVDDSTETEEGTPVTINVVSNDGDTDGNIVPATVAIVNNPSNGTAVHNGNGTVTYSPYAGFTGTDTFKYTVNDDNGATSNEAIVTITVNTGVVYTILKTDVKPLIDGVFFEYGSADSIIFSPSTGGNRVIVKVIWDTEALYISYKVDDTELRASVTDRDGSVWNDDSVEWFIDTLYDDGGSSAPDSPFMLSDDYHGIVSIRNTKYDSQGTVSGSPTGTWNGNWFSNVRMNGVIGNSPEQGVRYAVEVKIPWTSIGYSTAPPDGTIIGMSFAVNDLDSASYSSVMWPDVTSAYENASKWQKVILSGTAVVRPVNRYVCQDGCQYTTIQDAIDDSVPGDSILVAQGTYYENIHITSDGSWGTQFYLESINNILIQGGWSSDFSTRYMDPSLTVIDGNLNSVIQIAGSDDITIDNFTIRNGETGISAGSNRYADSIDLVFTNNLIIENYGRGVSVNPNEDSHIDLTLVNNIIARNYGGGIGAGASMHLTLINNTVTDNSAFTGGGISAGAGESTDITVNIINTIVWGNNTLYHEDDPCYGADDICISCNTCEADDTAIVIAAHSDIGNVSSSGGSTYIDYGDNVNIDPLFADPTSGDYHLTVNSPLIDMGTDDGAPLIDYEGEVRPYDGNGDTVATTDIGADEYVDTDGDGIADYADKCPGYDDNIDYDNDSSPAGCDCDDLDATINPDALEVCDGVDNNCNGQIDEGMQIMTYYADTDNDNYGDPDNSLQACAQPEGFVANSTDCDDNNPDTYPGAVEINDGVDNNCNGQVDEGTTPYFWLEAETATSITNPMQVANDGAASGGQYIWVPNGQGHNFDGTGGYAEYTVNITVEGEYILWGRVIAPTSSDDSFFVKVGSSPYKAWSVANGSSWQWDKVNIKGGVDPVIYHLTPGEQIIRIGQREDGTKLDKLLLTNDMDFIPEGFGGN